MCGPYWSQFSKQELDSMHGIEPEDYEDDDCDVDVEDEDDTGYRYGCQVCNGCMDCLDLFWSDFM